MSDATINIGGRLVGGGHKAFIIAEIAQAHDGSLGLAHVYIDAAAEAGVDAVKFQTHIASEESTLDEPFRVRFSLQDETRYAYWRRMEFSPEQWAGLAEHARSRKLQFLSSPFSLQAVAILRRIGVSAWKVASGEVVSEDMLQAMAEDRRPFLLSTGMSAWAEIDQAVDSIRSLGCPLATMQCTSQYPTPLERVGLNVIGELRSRYSAPAGLSDHSGLPIAAIAALARGADLLELHLTLDRRMFGPDVPASLDVEGMRQVVQARDAIETLDRNPVDKDRLAAEFSEMRRIFGRSLALRRNMTAGAELAREDLSFKKPGTGIPASEINKVIGRRLTRDVSADRLLQWVDLVNDK